LPTHFEAAVVVLHHVRWQTELEAILRFSTALTVQLANDHDVLAAGTVYVGPPDRHLFIRPDRSVGLSAAPPVRFARPSADWLLESAAAVFGPCSTAVVLSGGLSDGARGVVWMKRSGGHTIAQTPSSCAYVSMPASAIRTGCVDHVLDPETIASALYQFSCVDDQAALTRDWEAPFASTIA
jgi:two-component system chemotaxis response regulator CheB